jgi:hypothetical protein
MKTSLFALILAVGCAHQAKQDPLVGTWRVDEKSVTTGMPNYVLSPELYSAAAHQSRAVERAPASDEALAQEMEQAEKKPSLRRLYFRALYQQWRALSARASMGVCPQYHHDKLLVEEQALRHGSMVLTSQRPSVEKLALYPEWSLHGKPQQGIKLHEKQLKRELLTLCEEGVTDSYFRLENMVTYFAGAGKLERPEGFQALLKIPVFSTMLLVGAIQENQVNPLTTYDRELLDEVRGLQLQHYIVELKKKRSQIKMGAL